MYIKWTVELTHSLKKKTERESSDWNDFFCTHAYKKHRECCITVRERESFDRSDHLTPNEEDEEKKGGI